MAVKPPVHGPDHQPWGIDPARTERWHKCGDSGEPALAGTWTGKVWFKLVVGPPNHKQQSLEVVIAVDGGTGTITTLPMAYVTWADGEKIPGQGNDTLGAFRAFYIDGANGNIVDGPIP